MYAFFTNIQRVSNIVICNQHPDSAITEMVNNGFDVVYGDRVYPGERLIQQDKIGFCRQRSGDFNTAPFSAGQRLTQAVAKMLNVKFFQQLVAPLQALLLVQIRPSLQDGENIVADGELAKYGSFLG